MEQYGRTKSDRVAGILPADFVLFKNIKLSCYFGRIACNARLTVFRIRNMLMA
jgi:hypothetical protein